MLSRFSCVQLCVTPQTAAHQGPLSTGISRQGHWSGLPFPSPNVLYEVARKKKKKGKKKYCFFVYMEKQMNRQEKYSEKKFEYRLVLSLTLYLTQDHHKPTSFSLFLNFEASSCIHIIFQKYSKVSVKYSNMHPGERNNNTPKKKNIYSAHISSK